VKKLLCVIVAAGFLAGLGCGDSTTIKKEKETKTTVGSKEKTTTTTEKNEKKPTDK
jgi:hypothetical protein